MIETRVLRQFVAVAQELHFGRAAERLHMAQPPLSQAIRKLEQQIGVRLFERSNRSVALTPAGVSFYDTARQVLAQLESGIEQARSTAAGLEGQLNVTFIDTAHYEILPAILRTFKERYPKIELALQEATTAEQVRSLEAGEADVSLLRKPGFATGNLTLEPLLREEILLALPLDHPLAYRDSVSLSALAGDKFILSPRAQGPGFHDQLISLCHCAGFSPNVVQEARQMQTVAGLVAGGLGVALVPASLAGAHRNDVAFRPLIVDAPEELTYIELLLAWDARRTRPASDRFLEVAREVAAAFSQ